MISTPKPRVRTQGQTIYSADGSVKFRLCWNRYSDRVATFSSLENPYHWENGFCTYLGLPTKAVALAWQQHLLRTGVAKVAELRKVNRLKGGTPKGVAIRWELKLRGLTYEQLVDLLTFDLSQVPPEPEQTEASIEQPKLVYVSVDINDVPRGISLQETNDDLLVEYNVWVWAVVNEKGVPTPRQRHIGRLVEGMQGIEAFRPRSGFSQAFSRTFDAASYLLRASGYRTSDIELALQMNEQDPPTPAAVAQQPERGGLRQQPEATEDKLAIAQDETSESNIEQHLATELTAQPGPQAFQVGDRVEINSARHGVEFDWQIGIISVATAVGAAVSVCGTLRYFCADELLLVEAAAESNHLGDALFPSNALAAVSVASLDDF